MNEELYAVWNERVKHAKEVLAELGHEPRTRFQLTQAAIVKVDEIIQTVRAWNNARWDALVAMQCDEELRWHEKAREFDDAQRRLDDLFMGGFNRD
jgi:hypothetical protein